jgi:dienelactone hydrolase
MFEYFPDNYSWNMSVSMAVQLGGEMSEIDEACKPLKSLSKPLKELQGDWWAAWAALGERIRGLAERDRERGFMLGASKKLKRASIYFMMAERQLSHHDARKMASYDAMLETFRDSMELSRSPVQFVSVPYDGHRLPALFMPSGRLEPSPCMIVFDGFDVSKEWSFLSSLTEDLRSKGIASLHVDHPGAGGALRKLGLPALKEMDRPATASLNWLIDRLGIDAQKIGIIAPSLGGYYAFRSAAFEKRLACCVAWGARWDNDGSHGRILRNPGSARSIADWVDHAKWYYGADTEEELAQSIAAMTLEGGIAERIECPVLVAHGSNDRQVPLEQAHLMVDRAINSPRRDLKIFEPSEGGVEHCGVDNMSVQIEYMVDWIAEVLEP